MRPGSLWPSVVLLLTGCRTPTSVELRLSTDVSCADHPTTTITVSRSSDESAQPATVTSSCQPDGTIGSLVILPASAKDEPLGVRVVTSLGGDTGSACVPPSYGPTCIVSRRQLAFIPHEELVLPVQQAIDCAGVVCGQSQTCRKGSCVSSQVDLDHCKDSPGECGQELGPDAGAGGQGGVSGSSGQSGQAGAGAGQGGQGGEAGLGGGGGMGGAGQGGAGMSGASGQGGAGMGGDAGQGGAGASGEPGQGGAGASGESGQGGAGTDGGQAGASGGSAGSGGGLTVKAVSLGDNYSCALFGSGKVKCWGGGANGALGLGGNNIRGDEPGEMGDSLPFVDLGTGLTVNVIASGATHNCVIFTSGQVKCWGDNGNGQLGLGDTSNRGVQLSEMGDALPFVDLGTNLQVISLALSSFASCALFDNGKIKCWGWNGYGELGTGQPGSLGDQPGEMGDALPFVDLGSGQQASAIAAGFGHICALLTSGKVKCWGLNDTGQLGIGEMSRRGDGPGEMGDALPFVDLGTGLTASSIQPSNNMTCAVLTSGQVKCWGINTNGGLGLGDTSSRGDQPGEMGDALPAVDLGVTPPVTGLRAGYQHVCVGLGSEQLKCWGQNDDGELGLGDTVTRGDGPGEMGDALPFVGLGAGLSIVSGAVGFRHQCVLFGDGRIKCWGLNNLGQLGLGDTTNRGDKPGQMGDALPFVDLGTTP